MSPEQATGDQSIGAATDVYALACVLYEMLVAEPPHTGGTPQAILGKIIQGEPVSATESRRSVPAHVDAAIRRALEKVPADRFLSAREFAAALADPAFRHGDEAVAAGASGARLWNPVSITLAVLTVLSATVASWALLRPEEPPPVWRQVLSTEGWAAVDGPPFGEFAALAPDGSSMVLPIDGPQLALKMRSSTEIVPIPGTERARNTTYSPDGQWIAYAVGTEVFKRPLVGGSQVRLAEDVENAPLRVAMSWLDDGTILYERNSNPVELVQIPEDGGVVTAGTNVLHVVDLVTAASQPIAEDVVRAWYAPTGHVLFVRTDGALFAAPFDLDALAVTGAPIPLFEGVQSRASSADALLGADGTLLYAEGAAVGAGFAPLWVYRDGTAEPLDPALSGNFSFPAISPDGRRIAFQYETPGQGTEDVWIYDMDQRTFMRLTFAGENRHPFWSPDGREVGFASERDGLGKPFARPADLSAETRLLLADPEDAVYEGGWTPDGTRLIYRRGSTLTSGAQDIWHASVHPDSAGHAIVETPATEFSPALSPDGRWLAWASDETGAFEVYVRPYPGPGGQFRVSTDVAINPVWGPDGRELFYLTPSGFTVATVRTEPAFAVAGREQISSVQNFRVSALHPHWDVSPDGERILAIGVSAAAEGPSSRYVLVLNFFEELERLVGR